VQPDPIGPVRVEIDLSEVNLFWSAPAVTPRCMDAKHPGGPVPPWNASSRWKLTSGMSNR